MNNIKQDYRARLLRDSETKTLKQLEDETGVDDASLGNFMNDHSLGLANMEKLRIYYNDAWVRVPMAEWLSHATRDSANGTLTIIEAPEDKPRPRSAGRKDRRREP